MASLLRPWRARSAATHGAASSRQATLPLVLGSLMVAMPVATLPALPMGEVQALNRELGRLCADPPRQALSVCRIHARLVKAL